MKTALLTAIVMIGFATATPAQTVYDTVKYVIDGDTIQFKSMRCRLAYVDTPESGDNPKAMKDARRYGISSDRIYKAGRLAKRYTKSHIFKGVRYKIDVLKKKGRYGRNICLVYINMPYGEGASLNEMLVGDGLAVPFWRYIPSKLKGQYRATLLDAKKHNRGLWRIDRELILKMLMGYEWQR